MAPRSDPRSTEPPARAAAAGASVMVIAGELSGDMHAARLIEALSRQRPDLRFFGIGGDEMQAAGVELLVHARDMAVMGFSEVLRRYGFFRRVFHRMLGELDRRRPAAVILVDYPGFNLRFAAQAHARGVRVIYYVCPQVWAWGRGRIPKMARIIDRLIAIFPFEQDVFAGTGLKVDFAGHPLVDEAAAAHAAQPLELPWGGAPRVALLPGSRLHEIRRILPVMAAAAARLESRVPGIAFIVAAPSEEQARSVRAVLAACGAVPARLQVVVGRTREVLRQARAAMVASGTATVETSLMRCPMIVAYRVGALTYALGRLLVRVRHIGMVNIVAGREVCPEFIQGAATAAALADAVEPLLGDTPERRRMLQGLEEINRRLGPGQAAERAAAVVLDELGRGPSQMSA